MRIAVPVMEEEENALIAPAFGRARYFAIVENGKVVKFVENPGFFAERGAGVLAANTVIKEGVERVYTRRMGAKVEEVLRARGIEVVFTDKTSLKELLQ